MLIIILVLLGILSFLFWLGFKLTGALLTALIWICIKIPVGLILLALGLVFCVTILLFPIGKKCIGKGIRLIVPGI